MAKSTRERKFKAYQPLLLSLKRAKVDKAGAVATLLLECFMEDHGRLQSSKAVARGICEDGKFSAWRDIMVEAGWLQWNKSQADKGQYFAGKKLVRYINKEKLASSEVATTVELAGKANKSDVEKLEKKLLETQIRLTNTENELTEVKQKVDVAETRASSVEKRLTIVEKRVEKFAEKFDWANTPPDNEKKAAFRKSAPKHLRLLAKMG